MSVLHMLSRATKKFMETLVALSLSVLGLSVLLQIVLREAFSFALLPLDDIIPYAFSISTFAGAALLFGERGHIAITIFTDMAPAWLRNKVALFASAMVVAFLVFLLVYGFDFMLDGWYQFSPLLNIRLCYLYVIVPVCALSALLFLIAERPSTDDEAEQPQ